MIFWAILPLLLARITGLMGQNSFTADPDDIDDTGCLPKLADPCFAGVFRNLQCHFNPRAPYNCDRLDVTDMCNAIDGSLDCASDVIDTDCSPQEGRDRFDSWMRGLRAVHHSLCAGNKEMLKVLLLNSQCWDSLQFVNCVEREILVTHVVDLLKKRLDLQTCNHLLIATATCNVRATKPSQACEPPQVVVREVIQAFFSQSACGTACLTGSATGSSTLATTAVCAATLVQAAIGISLQ